MTTLFALPGGPEMLVIFFVGKTFTARGNTITFK